ncbi:MAG TPA: hypothetical protein VGX27_09390 [Candidatus Dormibacteraeota bacterium]|nr:hypothetical protein [Candidatus Dormibacteraeota bacterium]
MKERGPERRTGVERREGSDRRYGDRRAPERAGPGRRTIYPFDRRVAERRFIERRGDWPATKAEAY